MRPATRQWLILALLVLGVLAAAPAAYIQLNPQWVTLRHGLNLLAEKQRAEAIPFILRGVRGGAHSQEGVEVAVTHLLSIDRPQEALALLQDVTQSPRMGARAGAVRQWAGLLDAGGHPGLALRLLQHAAPPQDLRLDSLLYLADLTRRAGRWDEALELYTQARERGANSARTILRMAETHAWSGNHDEAARLLHDHLATNPRSRPHRLLLARTLSWAGRFEEALVHYATYLDERPPPERL